MDFTRMRTEGAAPAADEDAPLPAGLTADSEVTLKWLYADPARSAFGREVSAQAMSSSDTCVVKGASALVLAAAYGPPVWTFAELVSDADAPFWMAEKQAGANRVLRVDGSTQAPSAGPALPHQDAIERLMLVESMPSCPFEGVGAILEYLSGIAARGYEQSTFHGLWVRISGTTISSGLAIGHSLLMMLLHLWAGFDGTEVYYLTSAEEAVRRLVMIERAVERSSPPPDFDGLEVYVINTFECSAEVVTSDFSRHISDLTRTEAIIWGHYWMQQQRQDQEASAASQSSGAGIDTNTGGGGAGAASSDQ
jgi:hypothetical protein